MPQATLLDFFKSQIPGPFAPVISPAESTGAQGQPTPDITLDDDLEREPEREQPLPRGWPEDDQATTATGSQRQFENTQESSDVSNGPQFLPRISGLVIIAVENGHLPAVKRLTGNLLPVRYPDKFFDGAVSEVSSATFSRVALIDGKPVGWIRCRLDPFPEQTVPPSNTKPIYQEIYVQALCLLAPYRGLGIATSLLDAITTPALTKTHGVAYVKAHVWEESEEALEWYAKRGFRQIMKVDQYYRKLRPNGAWLVKKHLDDPITHSR